MPKPKIGEQTFANIPLNGKLRTAIDGTQLGEGDFQKLINMRYGELSPKSISGMTKINTSIINGTYLKPRSGFHFRKAQPSESHVLVQAWNTGLTASGVYENTTTIPNQGNFSATGLWPDTSGANIGRFSEAPDGSMIYANGKDTCVWGGSEYRCAGFVISDLNASVIYDYSAEVNNTLQDAANIATMYSVTETIDSNVMGLWHFDNSANDSSGHGLTWGGIGTCYYTNTPNQFKWGYATGFDGSSGALYMSDYSYFDFSGGAWTFDCWVRPDSSGGATQTIYSQDTDSNNYFRITLEKNGTTFGVKLSIYAASSEVVALSTSTILISSDIYAHIEVSENANDYYIFVNGNLEGHTSSANRPANYTRYVYLGTIYAGANWYKGQIDEVRISNVCRHISNFTPHTQPYGSNSICYAFIASTRPIAGAKFYIKTANATAATANAFYWAASWTPVTNLVDGTALTGKTLAQTGSVTFDTTVSEAKPKVINGVYAYWYLFTFESIDATTQVYYVTLSAPFQQIVDIWDGNERAIMTYLRYVGTTYTDETTNVLQEDYVSGDTLTYSDLGSFATSSAIYVAFAERTAGIDILLVGGTGNSNVSMMTVSYWTGSVWVSVGTLDDKTNVGNKSLAQSGTVTWDAPDESSEFQNSVAASSPWWFYKITFSAALSASVQIDKITGIPSQRSIKAHSYPVMWQNRVWLLDEVSNQRNSGLCSAPDTVCVFNGTDSTRLRFGNDEPLICGATLFTRFGGSVYDNLVVFKNTEVWIVDGQTPSNYAKYRISTNYGCVAPGTLQSCDTGFEVAPGLLKHILIWQSENAICMFDGNAVNPISNDIKNFFDRTKAECIPDAMKSKSESFYDNSNYEYHWIFASGAGATTLNQERVYDVLKKKWYQVDRGTGKNLQMGFYVIDPYGNNFNYGGIDTGYIERVENGTTFDGNSIISTFRIGDIPFGGYDVETAMRNFRLIMKAKTSTTNTVSITHYGDGITTSESTAIALVVNNSTKRIVRPTQSVNWGNYLFHSFECSLTTTNETIGFEPIGIGLIYTIIRESVL